VIAVATQNRAGKSRRYKAKLGVTRAWKKAIVKLSSEHKIDFF
jgi:large subunit ribosomal protein L23